jgi:arginase
LRRRAGNRSGRTHGGLGSVLGPRPAASLKVEGERSWRSRLSVRRRISLCWARPPAQRSLAAGHERAPAALRAAGFVARLTAAGFTVTDYGDTTTHVFQPDEEHPRARNAGSVLAAIEELRPKIEVAVKSGALPVVLGGDDSNVLGVIAGARRYFRDVGLIDVDRDAGLNVPATTPSGCVDGMLISHVSGRGAPELVRFWGEPPLVREPDVAIFGIARLDETEKEFLERSPLRRYTAEDVQKMGATKAAEQALERMHGVAHEFVLHVDLDVIAKEDFHATNLAAPGGLRLAEVRDALAVWARHPKLAALVIAAYNPELDPDGSAASRLIDLLVEVLSARLAPASTSATATEAAFVATPAVATPTAPTPAVDLPGEGEPGASPERENSPAAPEAAQSPTHSAESDSSVQPGETQSDSEASSQ